MSDLKVYIGAKPVGAGGPDYGEVVGVGIFVESEDSKSFWSKPAVFHGSMGLNAPIVAAIPYGLMDLPFEDFVSLDRGECSLTIISDSSNVEKIIRSINSPGCIDDKEPTSGLLKALSESGVKPEEYDVVFALWKGLFDLARHWKVELSWVFLGKGRRFKQLDIALEIAAEHALARLSFLRATKILGNVQ